ncbi:MAG: serine hydrolase domain-containing protein [Phycisphaerales bacterium JB039]
MLSTLVCQQGGPARGRGAGVTLFAAAAALWLVTGALARPQVADPRYDAAIELCRAAVGQLHRESGAPCVQVAVAVDGEIVWSEAFGWADLELRAPATARTKIRIASVSKALTGTLAAKLASESRLDLDAPVQQYVGFPQKQAVITCRMLAGHTSGVRHYRGGETSSVRRYGSLEQALTIFAGDALEHDPGADMTYSTYGYTLLGAAIEGATGAEFGALLREEILDPAGMTSTVVDDAYAVVPERAACYELAGPGQVRRARPTDHSYKIPGGGLLSTAEDLVRFGSAMLAPGVFSEETLELALTSCTLNDGRATGYGLGWRVARSGAELMSFGHGGSQPGSRAYLHVDADSGIVVAALSNATGAPLNRGECALIGEAFRATDPATSDPDIDAVGRYEMASREHPERTATLEIWRAAGGDLRGGAVIEGRMIEFDAVGVAADTVTMLGLAGNRLIRIRFSVDDEAISGALTAGDESAFAGRRLP